MNTLGEVLRFTFPRKLRFDKASQILYAECYSISKQHKHKKHIPVSEIQDVLDRYTFLPGSPWLQLPFVRHVLCIRFINVLRTYAGRKSWLYNRSVEEEYQKLKNWLEGQVKSKTSAPTSSVLMRGGAVQAKPRHFVERERFDREVLSTIHIATMYQRMARLGIILVFLLVILTLAMVNVGYLTYLLVHYWWHMNHEETMRWMREVTARHTVTDIPQAYEKLLPLPCERLFDPVTGKGMYIVNLVELVSEERAVTVMAVPCPLMGEKVFYQQVGRVLAACDCIILEDVCFSKIDKLAPAAVLPLRDNTFPLFGVHHRFLDILRGSLDEEPPLLFPSGPPVSWSAFLRQIFIPFEVRVVFNPTKLSATKAESRIGWGRVRAVIEEVAPAALEAHISESGNRRCPARPPHYVIGLPWTVSQIMNLEASLVKMGFRLKRVFPLEWIAEDHIGQHFCDYYRIAP